MDLLLRRHFRVASYDVGPRGEARPSALMGWLEEAAGEHAASWKLSVVDLFPRGLTWVLSRYRLDVKRWPRFGEGLEVATWPSGRSSMFATRDFEVVDADGSPVALATTSWAVLDLSTKKPVAVTEVVPQEFLLERRTLADGFAALPKLETSERDVELPVMLRDLDMNLHVNHVVYVQWALEAVPPEIAAARWPKGLEVSYRAEARLGDRVVSAAACVPSEPGERVFVHRIAHAQTGAELARVRSRWNA
jgi:acyl-ACP thioesterase